MMRTVPVGTDAFAELRFAGTRPKIDGEGVQRQNNDGNKLYIVSLAVSDNGSIETINVTIPEATPGSVPGESLDAFESCTVANLRAGFWVNDRGEGAWYFSADTVAATRPTTQARESVTKS